MSKKIVSAILTIALIASMFTLVFVVPTSAADFEIAADSIIPFCEAFHNYQAVVDFFGNYGDKTTETITIVDGKKTMDITSTEGAYAKDLADALAKYPTIAKALADVYDLYLFDDGHDHDQVKAKTYKIYGCTAEEVVAAYKAIQPIYEKFVENILSYGLENTPASDINNYLYSDVYRAVALAKAEGKVYNEEVYNKFMSIYDASFKAEKAFKGVENGDFSGFESPAALEEGIKAIALAASYLANFKIEDLEIKEVVYVEKIVEKIVEVEKVVEKIVYQEVQTSDN